MGRKSADRVAKVKKAAKKVPVSSAKSVAGKKAATPALKKVAKSNVASRKTVAAKKALPPSDVTVTPASASAAPEAASTLATL
jgi:hypothetical protein